MISTSYIQLSECGTIPYHSYSFFSNRPFNNKQMLPSNWNCGNSVFDSLGNELNLFIGVQISFLNINLINFNYELSHELSEQHIDIYNMNNSFYTNYGIPYSVHNSDMIHGDRVKDIYKEINFCYSNYTYKGVNYNINCHIGETLYYRTTLKVFSFYNNFMNNIYEGSSCLLMWLIVLFT